MHSQMRVLMGLNIMGQIGYPNTLFPQAKSYVFNMIKLMRSNA